MYWDIEVTPEEEERIIRKAAEHIKKMGMEVPAILFIETIKPLNYLSAQMGRFFIYPLHPILGDEVGIGGEKLFQVFEKRKNVEKLLSYLEEKNEKKPIKIDERVEEPEPKKEKKSGWRRFLPF
jgi:hypothetical protein